MTLVNEVYRLFIVDFLRKQDLHNSSLQLKQSTKQQLSLNKVSECNFTYNIIIPRTTHPLDSLCEVLVLHLGESVTGLWEEYCLLMNHSKSFGSMISLIGSLEKCYWWTSRTMMQQKPLAGTAEENLSQLLGLSPSRQRVEESQSQHQ